MKRLLPALLFAACTGSGSSSPPTTGGEDPSATTGSSTLTSLQQALTVADNVFRFDPDLAPGETADSNAGKMESRTKSNTAPCPNAKVTLTFTKLTIDFGPPPGCTLASGTTVSGALEASVSGGGEPLREAGGNLPNRDGGDRGPPKPLVVAFRFTKLVVNAIALDGAITFTTSNGDTFEVALASLATNVGTLNGSLKVVGAPGSMTIDGDLSVGTEAGAATINLAGVVVKQNDCYPSAGVETTKILVKTVGTFDAGTASSGKYTKQTGERKPETAYLAPYGSCPPGPPGAGDAGAK